MKATLLDEGIYVCSERFVSGQPKPKSPPEAVWINPPSPATLTTQEIAL